MTKPIYHQTSTSSLPNAVHPQHQSGASPAAASPAAAYAASTANLRMKLKGKRAKKSIAALVLASGTAASVGFTPFFHTMSTLVLSPQNSSKSSLFPSASSPNSASSSTSSSVVGANRHHAALAPGRRAFSSTVVGTTTSSTGPNNGGAMRRQVGNLGRSTVEGMGSGEVRAGGMTGDVGGSSRPSSGSLAISGSRLPSQQPPLPAKPNGIGNGHMVNANKNGGEDEDDNDFAFGSIPTARNPTTASTSSHQQNLGDGEEDEEDWDAEFNIDPSPKTRPSTLNSTATLSSFATPPQPRSSGVLRKALPAPPTIPHRRPLPSNNHNGNLGTSAAPISRRIQSAPSVALRRFGEGGGGGMVDMLLEEKLDPGRFLSDEVKKKVERRRERELERSRSADGGLESWDDDFLGGGNGAREEKWIPEMVHGTQESVRMDAMHVKEFALHVEDLQHLTTHLTALLQKPPSQTLLRILSAHSQTLDQCRILLSLNTSDDAPPPEEPWFKYCRQENDGLKVVELMGHGRDGSEVTLNRSMGGGAGGVCLGEKEVEVEGSMIPGLIRCAAKVKEGVVRCVEEVEAAVRGR
ncbi:hypothetical protein HDU97_008708 [Phlyctochytrium planicorne]|nr:hypothetical protein HDU97_008708 [Phlyctochytrium planicorne]